MLQDVSVQCWLNPLYSDVIDNLLWGIDASRYSYGQFNSEFNVKLASEYQESSELMNPKAGYREGVRGALKTRFQIHHLWNCWRFQNFINRMDFWLLLGPTNRKFGIIPSICVRFFDSFDEIASVIFWISVKTSFWIPHLWLESQR